MALRHVLVAALALAPVAALAPAHAADAAAGLVLIFERDLNYDMAATHGNDVLIVRGTAYKDVEVRVTVPDACVGLNGYLTVAPTPPPPIPPKVIETPFTCGGQREPTVLGAPLLTVYQGKDLPLVIDFAGIGNAVVHVEILGQPWS